jgi:formate-dependent nitrite reductase membrane component NrfD
MSMELSDQLDLRRQDLSEVYRPQREWIDGRGLLIVIAHFFSGIGAGAWLWSTLYDFNLGRWLAFGCVVGLSGAAHLAFLGRWDRFWRVLRRPHQSWISRGMWAIGVFALAAIAAEVPAIAASPGATLAVGVSVLAACAILAYEGFVYAASKAIPFWRTRLLPALYIAYGLRGGAALLLIVAAFGVAGFDVATVEAVKLWVIVSTAVLILLYLVAGSRSGGAAKESVSQLIAGRISPAFYGGTILVGILIPIALTVSRDTLGIPERLLLGAIGVTSLIGDFYVKYCIVKAGVYTPLVEATGVQQLHASDSRLDLQRFC